MATQILAVGSTATDSTDVTVADGSQLTVCLKDAGGGSIIAGAEVLIRLKDDAGKYFTIDRLDRYRPAVVIAGAGTYRFSRKAGFACGVFSA